MVGGGSIHNHHGTSLPHCYDPSSLANGAQDSHQYSGYPHQSGYGGSNNYSMWLPQPVQKEPSYSDIPSRGQVLGNALLNLSSYLEVPGEPVPYYTYPNFLPSQESNSVHPSSALYSSHSLPHMTNFNYESSQSSSPSPSQYPLNNSSYPIPQGNNSTASMVPMIPNRQYSLNGRIRFSRDQVNEMKKMFSKDQNPSKESRSDLARRVHLTERQVSSWFSSQKARLKRSFAKMQKVRDHEAMQYQSRRSSDQTLWLRPNEVNYAMPSAMISGQSTAPSATSLSNGCVIENKDLNLHEWTPGELENILSNNPIDH